MYLAALRRIAQINGSLGNKRTLQLVCSIRSNAWVRRHSTLDAYRDKLRQRAEKENISVEELLARSKGYSKDNNVYDPLHLIEKAAKKAASRAETAKADASAISDPNGSEHESPPKSSRVSPIEQQIGDSVSQADPHSLSSYIDVDKFKLHDASEIELLWKARFLNKQTKFSGVITPATFGRLYPRARKYPTFVLPLPHDEGVELHYTQWSFTSPLTIYCLITSLAEYKLHGEYARPHTTFMVHSDLLEQGVVLTNTSLQDNQVSLESAALLVLNLQRFYTSQTTTKYGSQKLKLLEQFNEGDPAFSVEELIAATETLD